LPNAPFIGRYNTPDRTVDIGRRKCVVRAKTVCMWSVLELT